MGVTTYTYDIVIQARSRAGYAEGHYQNLQFKLRNNRLIGVITMFDAIDTFHDWSNNNCATGYLEMEDGTSYAWHFAEEGFEFWIATPY